jgi:thiol-disulfide isomerase/thioredoxin
MNKAIYILVFIANLISSFIQAETNGFRIIGSVAGFADSTMLYLGYADGRGIFSVIDSTYIIHGHFVLHGVLDASVTQAMVGTKGFSNSKTFWLENTIITFNSQSRSLSDAVVIGPGTQKESNDLDSVIKTGKDRKQMSFAFIRSHPNSIISASLLNEYDMNWGRDTTAMLYHSLSKRMRGTNYGRTVREYLALNKGLNIGDKYVDFYETNQDDRKIYISHFKGRVILIEFWGSWCGPCRAKNPELVSIYKEFNFRGFEIFGVAAETDKDAWIKAINTDQLTWTNVTDLRGGDNEASLMYGVWYYPSNFLIDRHGIIIAKDIYGDALREKLRQLL